MNQKQNRTLLPIIVALLGFVPLVPAAYIDDTLNYQGRVSVQGVNFTGTGQFKFALVDGGTNLNQSATATALATAMITSVSISSGGSGYLSPPLVTIPPPDDPGGVQATATATIDGGVVTAITITEAGSGYFTNPVQVTIAPPPPNIEHQTYWSNAGDLAPGEVPATSVAVPVVNGLYSVQLGGTAPGMSRFDSDIFYTKLFLRVWFDDGVNGLQLLTPDQPLVAAPYALQARLAETVAPGTIGPAQLANGAAAANLATSGQSGVASGGVILSATENPALVAAGYVKLPAIKFDETWTRGSSAGAPNSYPEPVCVWTGTEMFVWVGEAFGGGLYNPETNTWVALSGYAPNAPPLTRLGACAVWTGSEVILWGGRFLTGGSSHSADGGRYNPDTNTWVPLPSTAANVPSAREGHSAVWTGTKMIVWGGENNSDYFATGGIYDPQGNGGAGSWTATSSVGQPLPSTHHSAAWTGSEMVIWGGQVSGGISSVGFRFNLPAETPQGLWAPLYNNAAVLPEGRYLHTMIWTGTHLVMWGGRNSFQALGNGYRYEGNQWVALGTAGEPPDPRYDHSAVWTGTEMIIWGGTTGSSLGSQEGCRYNFSTARWSKLTSLPPSDARARHGAVWTGRQMLIWGGSNGSAPIDPSPWCWTPERRMLLYQRP